MQCLPEELHINEKNKNKNKIKKHKTKFSKIAFKISFRHYSPIMFSVQNSCNMKSHYKGSELCQHNEDNFYCSTYLSKYRSINAEPINCSSLLISSTTTHLTFTLLRPTIIYKSTAQWSPIFISLSYPSSYQLEKNAEGNFTFGMVCYKILRVSWKF